MKDKQKLRVFALVIPVVVIASFGAWRYMKPSLAAGGDFTASGTIETTTVSLSPEVSGVLTELDAAEGQEVKRGDLLAKINDASMQAQYEQAKASLQSARENLALAEANYAMVSANNAAEQQQSALSAAEMEVVNAKQALQSLYDNAPITTANLQQQVAAAAKALDKAKDHVDSLKGASDPEDIQRAQANVVITKDALKKAKEDYDRMFKYYKFTDNRNVGRAYLQIKVSNAQDAYDHAVTVLTNLLGHANDLDLAVAEADAMVAEAQLADTQRRLDALVDGVDPKALELAKARLEAAQAKLAAIQADPGGKQLAVAQDQVDVAKAQVASVQEQLKALEIQLDKYTIAAPQDGVVLTRGVQVGETVAPGSILYEIGQLQKLQLTVYLPEEKFGTVKPGDEAKIHVDAYPGRDFTARVDRLSDKAEFTPRNVQTVEGRRDTVFAIYLSLDNSDLALMPGMWADVTFSPQ